MKSGTINNIIITEPASTATITIGSGKTFTCSNTLTFTGTDSSTLNIGTGGTLGSAAYLTAGTSANNVVQLNGSAQLPAVDGSLLTGITGSGLLIAEDSGYGLDNSSVGRGTVGTKAVSLEYSNNGSNYGSTGDYSFCTGENGTSSGTSSFSHHGTASGTSSVSFTGNASGDFSFAGGDGSSFSSGNASFSYGVNVSSSGDYSFTSGYRATASHYGEISHASGRFSANADCQNGKLQLRATTSSTSETEIFLDGINAQFTLEDNDAYTCRITFMGAQADGSVGDAVYQAKIHRQGTTTALSQSVRTILAWGGDTNLGAPTINITADDTNDALKITVIPANATATRWTAVVEYVKINY